MSEDGEVVRTAPNRRRGEELALVLEALGVPHRLERAGGAWALVVPWAERGRAEAALAAYEREPPRRRRVVSPAPLSLLGLHAGVVLAAFAAITGPRAAGAPWFREGSARAAALLGGEPWRALTALTLHADALHLLGNVIVGAVVLGALGGAWGWGVATLLTVASGGLGNLVNAWVRGAPHDAVGASTALFGAIGALAGTGFVERARVPFGRPWVTVAAAFGLLGMLGAAGDVLAHVFGLGVGLGLGMALAAVTRRAPGALLQLVAGGIGLASLAAAWALALAQ